MFHVFFAGIAVFATPAAAVAVWSIWLRLRATGHARLAIVVLVLCGDAARARRRHGRRPVAGLRAARLSTQSRRRSWPTIRDLPPDAKLAYACQPSEELAFWDARLLGLDAHTGRRIVPMCFQAETSSAAHREPKSPDIPSPLFDWAPQRALYPDSSAQPSAASVAAFLKANGIEYIYADAMHPNTLVPDAIPIVTSGQTQVLRIP